MAQHQAPTVPKKFALRCSMLQAVGGGVGHVSRVQNCMGTKSPCPTPPQSTANHLQRLKTMQTVHSSAYWSSISAHFRFSSVLLTYRIAKWRNVSLFICRRPCVTMWPIRLTNAFSNCPLQQVYSIHGYLLVPLGLCFFFSPPEWVQQWTSQYNVTEKMPRQRRRSTNCPSTTEGHQNYRVLRHAAACSGMLQTLTNNPKNPVLLAQLCLRQQVTSAKHTQVQRESHSRPQQQQNQHNQHSLMHCDTQSTWHDSNQTYHFLNQLPQHFLVPRRCIKVAQDFVSFHVERDFAAAHFLKIGIVVKAQNQGLLSETINLK